MTVTSKMNVEEEIDELADELMEFGSDEYRKLEQELAMVCIVFRFHPSFCKREQQHHDFFWRACIAINNLVDTSATCLFHFLWLLFCNHAHYSIPATD
jgi:hypothetical protein